MFSHLRIHYSLLMLGIIRGRRFLGIIAFRHDIVSFNL